MAKKDEEKKHEEKKHALATVTEVSKELALAMQEDRGAGFEEAGSEAFATPFLMVLQKLSPQVDHKNAAFVDGARPGDILNSVTQEIYDGDEGVLVIPVHYRRSFIEWTPREQGGGFVSDHGSDEGILRQCTRNEKGQDVLSNGNVIVDTHSHYALVIKDDGSFSPVIINMTSTQLKHSRRWMSMMQGIKFKDPDGNLFTPAMFSHYYRLASQEESNKKGTWSGWKITNEGPVTNMVHYNAAREFKQLVKEMKVRASYASPHEEPQPSEM